MDPKVKEFLLEGEVVTKKILSAPCHLCGKDKKDGISLVMTSMYWRMPDFANSPAAVCCYCQECGSGLLVALNKLANICKEKGITGEDLGNFDFVELASEKDEVH